MAGEKSRTGNGRVRRLVIVESPTKARKIAGYLGSDYVVESSRGHIRDLPRNAADVPAKPGETARFVFTIKAPDDCQAA